MIERLALVAGLLSLAGSGQAQNEELWDLYPAALEFELDPDSPSAGSIVVSWEHFGASASTLDGTAVKVLLEDAAGQLSLVPSTGGVIDFTLTDAWQWQTEHTDNLFSGNCRFDYALDFGTVRIEAGEGYRIGQREHLRWSGPAGACPDRVRWYLEQARRDTDFAWHLADWPISLAGLAPGETGAFRVALIHALRKTRRLLPLPDSGDVGADPVPGSLGSIGNGPERFDSIARRLDLLLFSSGFE